VSKGNTHKSQDKQDELNVRLDKWLWAARFYKTRSIARDMVQGGKVHYNGQRTKPSKIVEVGAVVKLLQGVDEKKRSLKNVKVPPLHKPYIKKLKLVLRNAKQMLSPVRTTASLLHILIVNQIKSKDVNC